MKCEEVQYLAPLYWSGELEAEAMAELDLHLKGCPECAQEMAQQEQCDELVQEAVLGEPVHEEAVRERVWQQVAEPKAGLWRKTRVWAPLAAAAAAAILLVGLKVTSFMSKPAITTEPANVYADAADDHNVEVVLQARRRWLYGSSEIESLVKERAGDAALVAALAPEGYHIDRVRVCELALRDYLHLVYSDGQHEVSFFVRRRGGEELMGEPAGRERNILLHADTIDKLQVAGFQSPGYTVLVVSGQPMEQTLGFARKAAASLPEVTTVERLAGAARLVSN